MRLSHSNPLFNRNSLQKFLLLSPKNSRFKIHNQEKKAAENEGKWQPSNTFVITAIAIGSCLDIIVVLLWARHENKKKQQGQFTNPNRLTNKKWFWYLVSMGIVLPKNGKLTFSLKNFILTVIFLVLLKFWLFDQLESI
ncbi:hypothetical protein [Cytobacillus firmus]|uniref:hypothetical protein n=1 Tax=Cytobacillus firmus TaxID=1399 RepID=UPI00202FFE76|nr:hypothetical protein [Cytobacillus firmus]URT71810.1 hypothetical protein NAF01_04920 [Cytobacillus firmus]